ncbi:MAG: HNH endonuclease [Proteobacteria bacterium]|nr:HNH endonuclease [Pseudomonadota bacterium]
MIDKKNFRNWLRDNTDFKESTIATYSNDLQLKRKIYPNLKNRIQKKSIYDIQTVEEYEKLKNVILDEAEIIKNTRTQKLKTRGFLEIIINNNCYLNFLEDETSTTLAEESGVSETNVEGAVKKITVNSYERDSKARRECIDHYRCKCNVCNFDFQKTYGEKIGSRYIHVHHIVPLSTIRKEYKVDAINDLIPVCPNCHAMLHKKNPPYSVKELQQIIEDNK